MKNKAQLINQTSGEVEYYTDPKILTAARELMGHIDVDPASSAAANVFVQAHEFFTPQDSGLHHAWCGNVWMNHPFGRAEEACTENCKKNHNHHSYPYYGNATWINYFVEEWQLYRMKQGLCITYACTSEKWFQPLFAFPICFLTPRTNYYLPDGTLKQGVTKGSAITYAGPHRDRFKKYFSKFGSIVSLL